MNKTLYASILPGSNKESLLFRWSDDAGNVRGWSWHPPSPKGIVVDFRGGTRSAGSVRPLHALRKGVFLERYGFATFMPEYPKDDMKGGKADRSFVLDSWERFRKEHYGGLPVAGLWGHSRGCMQAWMFAEDADLHAPIAMDCPAVDLAVSVLHRPDLDGMYRSMGIHSPEEFAKRRPDPSAIAKRHPKVLLQLCEMDKNVSNPEIERFEGALFGAGANVSLKRYPGAHCMGGEAADKDAGEFFSG